MLPATRLRLVAATGCVLALSACADSPTSSPTSVGPLASASATVVPTLACEVIDFDAFARGDYVTGIVAGPLNLSVSATAFSDVSGEVAGQARAFDTDFVSGAANDGTDMQWSGDFARCDDCQGLETTLMVQRLGTTSVLDNNPGGTLRLSGFSDGWWVQSFVAVDNDLNEPGIRLLVDGTLAATATPLGDGSVQTVSPAAIIFIDDYIEFVLGTATKNDGTGSGSIDEITVCRNVGGCTRTPGYWKNHEEVLATRLPIWLGTPGGAESEQVTTVDRADEILSSNSSNGIAKLRKHLLAAKLNIAGGVSVGTIASAITAADAFLALHDEDDWDGLTKEEQAQVLAWKDTFDAYNNGQRGVAKCS